ncbi:NUDIX hydrolase [Chromobacterium violaceum]|uniref:hypothetical protein n=1 Tax=Chromobacterium violaceum TaxID=536 RepID=UPI001CC53C0F|nr:hypothetical protein [Chromobacterium violaceum]
MSDVARRELAEETSIVCDDIRAVFQYTGDTKQHHMFVVGTRKFSTIAHPAQEIARCAWLDRQMVASITPCRLTPFIVEGALNELEDARLPAAA